jgi:hypothetical protein
MDVFNHELMQRSNVLSSLPTAYWTLMSCAVRIHKAFLCPMTLQVQKLGEKFLRYQELTSLTDYLLVAQRFPCLEHCAKQASGQWLLIIETHLSGSICITSINCRLPLAEVYEWVQFPTSEAPASVSNA